MKSEKRQQHAVIDTAKDSPAHEHEGHELQVQTHLLGDFSHLKKKMTCFTLPWYSCKDSRFA